MNLVPVGPNTHATNFNPETGQEEAVYFPLGTADTLGRDELLRLMYGARVSLEVAIGATLLSMFIGVLLGATAGYFRGAIDSLISRLTEIVMAFPLLLFVIALAATVGDRMQDITLGGLIPRRADARPRGRRLRLVLSGPDHPRAGAVARERVHRGGADGRLERLADHPVASAAHLVAPIIVYSRRSSLPSSCSSRPVSRSSAWASAADGELGIAALDGSRLLPPAAVADGLARRCRSDHDPAFNLLGDGLGTRSIRGDRPTDAGQELLITR